MKIATKIIGSFLFSFLLLGVTNSYAQKKNKDTANKEVLNKKTTENQYPIVSNLDASNLLNRTNLAISKAYTSVTTKKVYSGSLSKAVHHQKIAKKLLSENKNFRAIHHSRIARTLAFKALRLNKDYSHGEWDYTMQEQTLFGNGIPDEELTTELKNTYPNNLFLDEKVTEIDLKEIEIEKLAPTDNTKN